MIRKFLLAAACVAFAPATALAQAGGNYNNAVGIWGQDSITGAPCIVAPSSATGVSPPGGSTTCGVPFTPTAQGGNPATIYSGVQTCTTGAVALPSQTLANGVVIQATPTNTGTVDVGPATVTTSTGYDLVAGQAISYGVANLSAVYLICANATDTVSFTGN